MNSIEIISYLLVFICFLGLGFSWVNENYFMVWVYLVGCFVSGRFLSIGEERSSLKHKIKKVKK